MAHFFYQNLNFVQKYYGKITAEIEQCKKEITLKYIEKMVASMAETISQLMERMKELLR